MCSAFPRPKHTRSCFKEIYVDDVREGRTAAVILCAGSEVPCCMYVCIPKPTILRIACACIAGAACSVDEHVFCRFVVLRCSSCCWSLVSDVGV